MKRAIAGVVVGLSVLGLTACGSNNFRDVEGVNSRLPDSIEVFSNVDQNPNVAVLCIHGAGFASTTRDFTSLIRVPEWDKLCPAATIINGHATGQKN